MTFKRVLKFLTVWQQKKEYAKRQSLRKVSQAITHLIIFMTAYSGKIAMPFRFRLFQNLLRFDVVEAKKLESKLNQTQEREVMTVYEITDKSGKRSILHLEFQKYE